MKPVPADEAPDATVLRAAPEPEIVLIVSDTGGASLVDSKAAASETNIPDLGDHATLVFGPVSNDANARRAFRVWVSAASRSYALFYSPTSWTKNRERWLSSWVAKSFGEISKAGVSGNRCGEAVEVPSHIC